MVSEARRPWFKLGGQLLYLSDGGNQGRGKPISADPASDFNAGIKTGPVDYDQRLHTEFIAIDDYSGGQGFDRVSSREDIGLYWKSTKGVDTTRSKHIMAPPYFQKVFEQAHDYALEGSQARSPIPHGRALLRYNDKQIFGWPGLFLTTDDGLEFTLIPEGTGTPTKLIGSMVGVVGGATRHYLKFLHGSTGPSLKAFYTTNGTSFTAESTVALWDVMFAQGYFWALDEDGISLSTTFPTTGGFNGLPSGYGQFIGPGKTPTGRDGVYFIKGGRMFYAVKAEDFVRTEWDETGQIWVSTYLSPDDLEIIKEAMVAPGFNIVGAVYYNTTIVLTNGYSALSYQVSGSQEVPRDIGFQNFRAATPEIRGGMIRAMTADSSKVYVAVQNDSDTYILSWNERGWNLMKKISNFVVHYMDIGQYPVNSWPTTKRSLYVVGQGNQAISLNDISVIRRPSSNGPDTGWTGDFDEVEEEVSDDDGSYITINTSGTRESFSCVEANSGNGQILSPGRYSEYPFGFEYRPVKLIVHAIAKEVGGDATIDLFIRTADTSGNEGLVDSTAHTLTTSYVEYQSEFLIEPDESKPWIYSGYSWYIGVLNNSNIEVRVSQMWVEVVYSRTAIQVWEAKLPVLSLNPTLGVDEVAYDWDLYTGWMDGGFKDLRGALYEFLASGDFSETEYVDVYYMLDNDETEILLGRIDSDGEDLHWGTVSREGVEFRSFRLRFVGVNGHPDLEYLDREVSDVSIPEGSTVDTPEEDWFYMVPFNETAKKKKIAQSFTPTVDTTIKRVAFRLGQIWNLDESNPDNVPSYTGKTITCRVIGDFGGIPEGLEYSELVSIDASKLDGAFEVLDGYGLDGHGIHQAHSLVVFEFEDGGFEVQAGDTIWIVIAGGGDVSTSVWYGAVAYISSLDDWYDGGKAMYYDEDESEWINVPTNEEIHDLIAAHWTLQEGTTNNRLDSTHHNNDLVPSASIAAVAAIQGNGADFEEGDSRYLSKALIDGWDYQGEWTIGFWARLETITGNDKAMFGFGNFGSDQVIRTRYSPSQGYWRVALTLADASSVNFNETNYGVGVIGEDVYVVTRHRVTGVNSGSIGIAVWKAGTPGTEITQSYSGTTIPSSNGPFIVGADNGGTGEFFDGLGDEFTIINGVLSDAAIARIVNSGSGVTFEELRNIVYSDLAAGNADLMFKVGFDRKSASDMEGFVVSYDKRPPFRAQWQLPIDIGGMIDDGVEVEGEKASVQGVMNYLEKCWNSKPMLEFEIPDKADGNGDYTVVRKSLVKLSAMPLGFEVDTKAGARMDTTIQLLELTHQLSPDEDQ